METKFQTSFIPKKPITSIASSNAPVKHHGTSFFMGLAIVLFVASLAALGGIYAWKYLLISAQDGYKVQLAEREKQFNTDLIAQLKESNVKIDAGRQLLRNHLAASQIFDIIGHITIQNVRFLSMDLAGPAKPGDDLKVTLNGYGTSFSAVAFQSDVLNQLEQYGLRRAVKNPILSDPSLDGNGTVSFGFTAAIDPDGLSYEKSVVPAASGDQASTTDSTATSTQ